MHGLETDAPASVTEGHHSADTPSVEFARAIVGLLLFLGVVFLAVLTLGLFFGMMAAALLALAMSARGRSF